MFDKPRPFPKPRQDDLGSLYSYSPNLVKEVTAFKPISEGPLYKRLRTLFFKSNDPARPNNKFMMRANSLRSLNTNADDLKNKKEVLLKKPGKDNKKWSRFKKSFSCVNLNRLPNNDSNNDSNNDDAQISISKKHGSLNKIIPESQENSFSKIFDPDKLRILKMEMSILLYIVRDSSSNYGMKLLRIECINIVRRYIRIMKSFIENVPFNNVVKLLRILEEIIRDIKKHIVFFYIYFKDLLLVLYKMDTYMGLSILNENLGELVKIVDENFQKVHCQETKQIQILIQYLFVPCSIENPLQQMQKFLPTNQKLLKSKIELFELPIDHWSYRLKRLFNIKQVSFSEDMKSRKLMLVFSPISDKTLRMNKQTEKLLFDQTQPNATVPIYKLLITQVQSSFIQCPVPVRFGSCIVQVPDSSIHEVRALPFAEKVKPISRKLTKMVNETQKQQNKEKNQKIYQNQQNKEKLQKIYQNLQNKDKLQKIYQNQQNKDKLQKIYQNQQRNKRNSPVSDKNIHSLNRYSKPSKSMIDFLERIGQEITSN